MNINILNSTHLLPNEAAVPLVKGKAGSDPALRSHTINGIEAVEKSAKDTEHRKSASQRSNAEKHNGRATAGKSPAKELTVGAGGKEVGPGTSQEIEQDPRIKSEADGPQLQLLKRQLAAKRSLARQLYLNTLETKVIDNVDSEGINLSDSDNIAEVTETLNDYAQIIKRDLTFSQQEGNTNVAVHDRTTGELIRTISSEEATEMSEDLDQFKTGHLLEVRI